MRFTRQLRRASSFFLITAIVASTPALGAQAPRNTAQKRTVDAAWLKEHLNDRNLVVLHVGVPQEYEAGHIPGALLVDPTPWAAQGDTATGKTFELPDPNSLRPELEKLGIGDSSTIVVYFSNSWYSPTTRVIFTLRHLGLDRQTFMLDGGLPQWKAAGNSVVTAVPTPARGRLSPRSGPPLVATLDDVRNSLNKPGIAIVDARAEIHYNSKQGDAMMRGGFIPGAVNIPFTSVFSPSSMLRSESELRNLFATAGVKPGDSIIVYCHVGQQATTVWFAAEMLGYNVRMYDGSFHEWSKRTDLPVQIKGGN